MIRITMATDVVTDIGTTTVVTTTGMAVIGSTTMPMPDIGTGTDQVGI